MRCRELLALLLALPCAAMVACDGPSPPGDADVDADGDADADLDAHLDGLDGGESDGDGDGEREPSRHDSYVPEDLRPTSATRLVVMGDAQGFAVGASSELLSFYGLLLDNDDSLYPAMAGRDLTTFFGQEPELLHLSQEQCPSSALASQLAALESRLGEPAEGHTLVLLSVGMDDVVGAWSAGVDPAGEVLDRAMEHLRAFITRFGEGLFPEGASIYLLSATDPTDGVGQVDGCFGDENLQPLLLSIEAWRARYRELAVELGFAVVDVARRFLGHCHYHDDPTNPYYHPTDPSLWLADCLQPNDRGNHEIRRLLYEAIDPSYVVE